MKKISLAMALKVKARLIGEINELKASILSNLNIAYTTHDGVIVGRTPDQIEAMKHEADEIYIQYKEKETDLCDLKFAIQTANAKILPALAILDETKMIVKFHEQLRDNITENYDHIVMTGKDNAIVSIKHSVCALGKDFVSQTLKNYQNQVNTLQDELDVFNAVTFIEWKD
jgi:hypothetical protein